MDATIDLLTGARILKAERKGVCIELTLEDRQTAILGDKVVYGELVCLGCAVEAAAKESNLAALQGGETDKS